MKHLFLRKFIAVFSLLFITGTIYSQEVPQEVRESIIAINKQIEKYALAGEFTKQFDFFTDDAIIDHPLEPPIKGNAALRSSANRMIREGVKYLSMGGDIESMWMCGDKVYERGTWAISTITKDRKQPIAAYGSYFQIWQKNGPCQYRIEYLIFTFDHNPYDIYK